jgi:hypothetical protein
MSLVRPEALLWALLAVPLVVLYLRGDRIRQQVVSAGSLWQKVLAERPARARWLRWRRAASLAAHLTILLTLIFAQAEPAALGFNAWWRFLAIIAIVLLLVEWRLFQRRWTC